MTAYQEHLSRTSDIQQHLGLLHGLACAGDVDQVVELGFRTGVSASAFLATGKRLLSIDLDKSCKAHVSRLAKDYPHTFTFKVGDSRVFPQIECDLLFIDSDHTYATTLAELEHWETFVSKWIVLHDTTSFGRKDRPPGNGPGVMSAIDSFLEMPSDEWMQWLHLRNNNGLTILKRR